MYEELLTNVQVQSASVAVFIHCKQIMWNLTKFDIMDEHDISKLLSNVFMLIYSYKVSIMTIVAVVLILQNRARLLQSKSSNMYIPTS